MGRFENPSKLHIIPNFVDTDLYNPKNVIPLDEKLFPKTHALKLLYAGNIGLAQDWSPLVALVEKTKVTGCRVFCDRYGRAASVSGGRKGEEGVGEVAYSRLSASSSDAKYIGIQ